MRDERIEVGRMEDIKVDDECITFARIWLWLDLGLFVSKSVVPNVRYVIFLKILGLFSLQIACCSLF